MPNRSDKLAALSPDLNENWKGATRAGGLVPPRGTLEHHARSCPAHVHDSVRRIDHLDEGAERRGHVDPLIDQLRDMGMSHVADARMASAVTIPGMNSVNTMTSVTCHRRWECSRFRE